MRWNVPRSIHPQQLVPVSPTALQNGLVWAVYPGVGLPQDIVSGVGAATPNSTSVVYTAAAYGAGVNGVLGLGARSTANNAANRITWPFSKRLLHIKDRHTIVVAFARVTGGDSFGQYICVPYSSSWTNPFIALAFFATDSATAARHSFSVGGVLHEVDSSGSYVADTDYLVFYGVTRNGTSVKFYKNGALHSSATAGSAGNVDFTNEQPISLFNTGTATSLQARGTIGFAGVWNRDLSEMEMREVSANPLALLAPAPGWWRLLNAAAAAPGGNAFPHYYYQQMRR